MRRTCTPRAEKSSQPQQSNHHAYTLNSIANQNLARIFYKCRFDNTRRLFNTTKPLSVSIFPLMTCCKMGNQESKLRPQKSSLGHEMGCDHPVGFIAPGKPVGTDIINISLGGHLLSVLQWGDCHVWCNSCFVMRHPNAPFGSPEPADVSFYHVVF